MGKMGKLPDMVYGRVGIGAYAGDGNMGAPIIQFVSGLHLGCVFPGRYG